jgi:diguanylate cyclase
VVSSSIHLAHSLGLRMVAEGVEDGVAYAQLAAYGCNQVQGFHVSRPLPAAELDDWLAARRAGGGPRLLLTERTGTVHP